MGIAKLQGMCQRSRWLVKVSHVKTAHQGINSQLDVTPCHIQFMLIIRGIPTTPKSLYTCRLPHCPQICTDIQLKHGMALRYDTLPWQSERLPKDETGDLVLDHDLLLFFKSKNSVTETHISTNAPCCFLLILSRSLSGLNSVALCNNNANAQTLILIILLYCTINRYSDLSCLLTSFFLSPSHYTVSAITI